MIKSPPRQKENRYLYQITGLSLLVNLLEINRLFFVNRLRFAYPMVLRTPEPRHLKLYDKGIEQ